LITTTDSHRSRNFLISCLIRSTAAAMARSRYQILAADIVHEIWIADTGQGLASFSSASTAENCFRVSTSCSSAALARFVSYRSNRQFRSVRMGSAQHRQDRPRAGLCPDYAFS
jgi:hypothetical protein